MKHWSKTFLAVIFLLTGAGCTVVTLQDGRYKGSDRGEFAMVYKDLVFMRVQAAPNIPGSLKYWEWGGKYSIDPETRRIKLDMDREIGKLWCFCYNIYAGRNAIILQDLTENKKYRLEYEHPALVRQPVNAPRPYSSAGVDPVYQPLAPVK